MCFTGESVVVKSDQILKCIRSSALMRADTSHIPRPRSEVFTKSQHIGLHSGWRWSYKKSYTQITADLLEE